MRLSGKKALVTGGARGIGLGCARMMAAQGAAVVIADIDEETAREEAAAIEGCSSLKLDVTSRAGWLEAIAETDARLGGLNVLVNNAGIIIPGTIDNLDEQSWDRTMEVDLKSVFLGCQAAMPVLSRCQPASIINIASIASMIASPYFVAYNAAKAGVHLLTKSVASMPRASIPGSGATPYTRPLSIPAWLKTWSATPDRRKPGTSLRGRFRWVASPQLKTSAGLWSTWRVTSRPS
jgi:NAD(P)-dependent dehydrogenase (short-subunit alcohol dehydrogenase family)